MDSTTITSEPLQIRPGSLVLPEHELNFIKEQILIDLTENVFISNTDPAKEVAMHFLETASQVRDGIANATNHEEIVQHLQTLKEPAKKFRESTSPDSPLGFLIGKFSDNLKTDNPTSLVSNLSQSFRDKYTSGFFDEQKSVPPTKHRIATFFKNLDDEIRDAMGMKKIPSISSEDNSNKLTFTKHTPQTLLESTGSLYDRNKELYDKLDNETVQPMLQKFGFNSFITNSGNPRTIENWVENFNNGSQQVVNNMGMKPDILGHRGNLGLARNEEFFDCGAYSPDFNILVFPNFMNPDTIVHEWAHSVDFNSAKKVAKEEYLEAYAHKGHDETNFTTSFMKTASTVHSSKSDIDIVIKNTPLVKGFLAVRDIMATALAGNVEDVIKHRNRERNDINQQFWRENLGDTYHTLSKETRSKLDSDETFNHIRNSIKRPNDPAHKEQIIQCLQNAGIHSPEIAHKITNPNPDSTFHKNAPNMVIEMEEVNIGKNSLFKMQANILDGIKNWGTLINGNQGQGNAAHSDYFRSNVEMFARYVQSNAFPHKPKDLTELLWRKHGIDKSWDEQRKNLLVSNFGENSLAEQPQKVKENSFVSASAFLIKSIASERFNDAKETLQEVKEDIKFKITKLKTGSQGFVEVKLDPSDEPVNVSQKPKLEVITKNEEIHKNKNLTPSHKPKI